MAEGDIYWTLRGREYRLGAPIEGADGVYSVPLSHEVLAVIQDDGSDPGVRERKLEAMLKRPPALSDIVEDGERFVRMDWPLASLHDKSSRFAGFLMPAVDLQTTSPFECVLQERQARAEGLPTSLGARINLAARLAVAITELHQQEHRVVHLSPANLRIHRQSLHLALIGCEHFSIRANYERFAADPGAGGIPYHYLAPEFQDQPILPGKEESQDRFALAVMIFQLLNFGIHPFTGIPTRDDVPEDIPGRIARNCYSYGSVPSPDLEPSPGSGHLAIPKVFRTMFDRAFSAGGGARPPAMDWATWLQFYAIPSNNCVVVCSTNTRHHHFADLPCAACARAPLLPGIESDTDLAPKYEPYIPLKDEPVDPVKATAPPFVQPERAFPPANRFPAARRPEPSEPSTRGWKAPHDLSWLPKIALLALLFLVVRYGVAFMFSPATNPEASVHASVRRPVDAPAAPATDPSLAGYPALEQSEALTDGYVTAAALAITTDDRTEWQRAITNLHTDVPAHAPAPQSEFQAAYVEFSAGLSPDHFDEGKWQRLLNQLRQVLKRNPYDDQTAYELGWLSLVGGKRDEARNFFLHAIWVNPDRANAWYGLGIIGADDNQKIGALATAELLTTDPTQAESLRNAFPPLLLRLSSVNPDDFAGQLEKAGLLAEHYRPLVASPKFE